MVAEPLSPSARRVQDALDRLGHAGRVRELASSTRTAAEAAAAIGCTVAQIAKSLVFRSAESGRPVLVIASGTNRVDEAALGRLLADRVDGEAILRAEADFVRARTGYAIGGVPPIGHAEPLLVVIDRDLLGFATIWAAAGTPRAVFEVTPEALVAITGGLVAEIAAAFGKPPPAA